MPTSMSDVLVVGGPLRPLARPRARAVRRSAPALPSSACQLDRAGLEHQHDGRAEPKRTELVAARESARRARCGAVRPRLATSRNPRRGRAGCSRRRSPRPSRPRLVPSDADESSQITTRSLLREQSLATRRDAEVHRPQLAGHVVVADEPAVDRRVDAMIVAWRQIDRRVVAAVERRPTPRSTTRSASRNQLLSPGPTCRRHRPERRDTPSHGEITAPIRYGHRAQLRAAACARTTRRTSRTQRRKLGLAQVRADRTRERAIRRELGSTFGTRARAPSPINVDQPAKDAAGLRGGLRKSTRVTRETSGRIRPGVYSA